MIDKLNKEIHLTLKGTEKKIDYSVFGTEEIFIDFLTLLIESTSFGVERKDSIFKELTECQLPIRARRCGIGYSAAHFARMLQMIKSYMILAE